MASIALNPSRSLFSTLRSHQSSSLFRWSGIALPTVTVALPTLQSLLDLFPPFLLAVPKKKVSHSRKSMRSANKGLKDKTNIVNCPGCGGAKLAHHLCPTCYSSMSRNWKAEQKELVEVEMSDDYEPAQRVP